MSEDLVERARCGDADAWRELYEATTGRLLVWLRARPSGDAAVAPEDVAAEAWLVAAQSIAEFTGDADAFAGWLFGIARNLVLNARRRTTRRGTDPADTLADPSAWGVTGPVDDEVAATDWVRSRLATLSPREAEVLATMEVAGLDARQTAAALGLSVTAVRVARHRGLTRLRRSAEPRPVFDPA
ncbi:MAG TPA: sigma-70 family RNA polymerase sigma factor [Nocardioides sp.]|nr:sigma-70 family RNA polymerase sigma factor [Nocardioides sp.]